MDSRLQKASAHWDAVERSRDARVRRFWQVPEVIRHNNWRLTGEALDGWGAGLHEIIRAHAGGQMLERAVSVGGGVGVKEMALLDSGLVGEFWLYEIAEGRITKGRTLAEQRGLADRMHFVHGDAFELERGPADLVYWDGALHHMLDVEEAVRWSRDILRPGGFIAVNDYVGPDRMQFSDRTIEIANRIHGALPDRFFADPDGGHYPAGRARPTVASMLEVDPTEGADSARIVEVMARYFPDAVPQRLGGAVYGFALDDLIGNFEGDDAWVLQLLLIVDDLLAEAGDNHYAVFVGRKPEHDRPDRGRLAALRDRLRRRLDGRSSGRAADPVA